MKLKNVSVFAQSKAQTYIVYCCPITRPIACLYCASESFVLGDEQLSGGVWLDRGESGGQARVMGGDKGGKVNRLRVRLVRLWIVVFNFFFRRNVVPAMINRVSAGKQKKREKRTGGMYGVVPFSSPCLGRGMLHIPPRQHSMLQRVQSRPKFLHV